MLDFAQVRRTMVDSQLRTFDVNDLALLAAMESIPRERFVAPGRESLAYIDQDVPVAESAGERRFMLAPMVLGRLIQALDIGPGSKILDVACGFGYSAAVMARLGAAVIALEADETMVEAARARLAGLGVEGVAVVGGPLDEGYPKGAPYDAILINGAIEQRPRRLLEQLADGGRLACIEGRGRAARATLHARGRSSMRPRRCSQPSARSRASSSERSREGGAKKRHRRLNGLARRPGDLPATPRRLC
jgi:protein-L-isoaspartate(D-aspartate) O-methyltransferase